MPHEHSEENPVEVLAEEFAKRIRSGEHPSIHDYVSRYPDHADVSVYRHDGTTETAKEGLAGSTTLHGETPV